MIDIVRQAYETGLQVGVTLTRADFNNQEHGEFCHMCREGWLMARRSMAMNAAEQALVNLMIDTAALSIAPSPMLKPLGARVIGPVEQAGLDYVPETAFGE